MSFHLRPYQTEIIDRCRSMMKSGCHKILITSPTGSGKTAFTAQMLKTAAEKGLHSWFCVHRRELVKQSLRAFFNIGVNAGVISAGFQEDRKAKIQIASIQTLARRLHKYPIPKLIVWDETHHLAAGSWSTVFYTFSDAFHVGLTATPERLDGQGLNKFYDEMIVGKSVSWLIENGYLSPYKLYAPSSINTGDLHIRMGDFAKDELNKAADKPTITGDAIKHYLKYAAGKRAAVFCVSIEHSKHVVAQFNANGIPAEHVDGETDTDIRDAAIARFATGETKILSNVELFGEGFDCPSMECAILLRPTQSLALYLQQVGRALRPYEGKSEAIILDHAGNCQRHGLPDEDRVWSLQGRTKDKKNGEASTSVRICPKCFACIATSKVQCTYCGFTFEIQSRKVAEVEGELVEVNSAELRQKRFREQGYAKTLEDLIELGKRRGYKRARLWAKHIWNYRQSKKYVGDVRN